MTLFGTKKFAAWSTSGTRKFGRMLLYQRESNSPGQRKWVPPSWEAVGLRPWAGLQGS